MQNVHARETLLHEIRHRMDSRKDPLVVALDGRSGTGKSTLAASITTLIDSEVIESDLFYAGGTDANWTALTPVERADRVIDWRRLRTEVLVPLASGRHASWRPFDFAAGFGLAKQAITHQPTGLVIIDGAYSSRPELEDLVDFTVLVTMPDDTARRRRLIAREGAEYMAAWHQMWDAAEQHYFTKVRPPSSFDLVVTSHLP